MNPVDRRIFEALRRAGTAGLTLMDLIPVAYAGREPPGAAIESLRCRIHRLRKFHQGRFVFPVATKRYRVVEVRP